MKLTFNLRHLLMTAATFGALFAGSGGNNLGVVNAQTLNDLAVGLDIPEFSADDLPVFSGQPYIIWLDQELVDDIKAVVKSVVPEEYHRYINHVFVKLNGFSVRGLPDEVLQALEASEFVTSVTPVSKK